MPAFIAVELTTKQEQKDYVFYSYLIPRKQDKYNIKIGNKSFIYVTKLNYEYFRNDIEKITFTKELSAD